jgi:membrane protease YdiL (CAAX protease family)
MSILIAAEDVIAPAGLAMLAVLAVLGLSVMKSLGMFSARDPAARARLFPGDPVTPLVTNAGMAIFAYFLAAVVIGLILRAIGPSGEIAGPGFSPGMMIVASCLIPLGSLIAECAGLSTIVPNGFARVGLAGQSQARGIWTAIGVTLAAFPMVLLVTSLAELVYRHIGWQHETSHALLRSMGAVHSPTEKILAVFAAVVIAPLNEEILFRGHVQNIIRRLLLPRGIGAPVGAFPVVIDPANAPSSAQVSGDAESRATAHGVATIAKTMAANERVEGSVAPVEAPDQTPVESPQIRAQRSPASTPAALERTAVEFARAESAQEGTPVAATDSPAVDVLDAPAAKPPPLAVAVPVRVAGRRTLVASVTAVVITSVLFAAIHPGWSRPSIFVLSLFLGLAYERRGNLWTTIAMHALFNGTMITLFLFMQRPGP